MTSVVDRRGGVVELVATGPWDEADHQQLTSGSVERLVLNDALGFCEADLGFLSGTTIKELVVLSRSVRDLRPVQSLGPTLERLAVTTHPGVRLDLRGLTRLRALSASWSQVERSIDHASQLEELFLLAYTPSDLEALSPLTGLRTLTLKDRPALVSLSGLAWLPHLTSLEVFLARKLVDLQELEAKEGLQRLQLQSCSEISAIDLLGGCVALRYLNLSECGEIASIKPLRSMAQLRRLHLFGTTKIVDGDLSPLLQLPELRELRMRSRRSYRPSVPEVRSVLDGGTS